MDSRDHFRAHFEQAPFSMQLLSPEGKTLAVNRAWKDLWKIPEDIIENYILKDYNVGTDPQLDAKGIGEYVRRGIAGEIVEIPPILYDPQETGLQGDPKWVTGFMYPVKDKDGKIIEIVLTHQNITERKKAEAEAEKLTRELKAALSARDEFISVCSHELKTPITSIRLQAQIAEKLLNANDPRLYDKANYEKRIATTNRQLNRMMRLIDEMLDVSRINYGKLESEKFPIDLREILEELLERFTGKLATVQMELFSDLPEGQWIMTGDRFRLEQVFSNILTNAMKFGDSKPMHVKLSRNGTFARVEFTDNGIGIGTEDIERIFGRFERVESSRNTGGLGLGLFISKEIVTAHQGRIWAEKNPAAGTSFIVELPLNI